MVDETPVNDEYCYDNGDYYEGQMLNGLPHGKGTMYYIDGAPREGYWRYGVPITKPVQDVKIPGVSTNTPCSDVSIGKSTFTVGFGYDNATVADATGVSHYIRGIRVHHETAVLFSIPGSVYKDGSGWEMDEDGTPVFRYTGEGLHGDQELSSGNRFLVNSIGHSGNRIYLFVKKHPNEYVFHGVVTVRRFEICKEPDAENQIRDVYSFVLRRV